MAIVPKLLIILIVLSAIVIPIVHADVLDDGLFSGDDEGLFSFLTGEEGLLARLFTFGEDDYVQYFAALFSIAAVVGAGAKAGLRRSRVVESERTQTGIALVFGIGVANGLFFLLRSLESVNDQSAVLWGGFFSLIGIVGMIVIPIWLFMQWGGDGR